jgi:hypothetical protein
MNIRVFFIAAFCLVGLLATSQEQVPDSTGNKIILEPLHRNVIKFNPTPMLLFSNINNITFSYERLIKDDQSVALQVGYLDFDGIFQDTVAMIIDFVGNNNQPGFNIALDYRYYPGLRNRRPAPDGVYIGGYVSYYGFELKNNFDILYTSVDNSGSINGKLNVVNLGFNLGYQFIFWERLSLDLLVFGPSVNYTSCKGEISGDLDQEQIDAIDDALVEKILDKYPVLGEIFSDDNLSFSENRTKFGTGFRYSISIGFHF